MSRLGNHIRRIAGTAIVGGALVGIGAGAAAAAPAGCASGYACFWEDANYKTDGSSYNEVRFYRYYTAFSGLHYYENKDAHDNVSSLYNNGTQQSITVYKNTNFGGQAFSVPIGHYDGDLGNAYGHTGFNDELDSGCFSAWC